MTKHPQYFGTVGRLLLLGYPRRYALLKIVGPLLFGYLLVGCTVASEPTVPATTTPASSVYLVVLGTVQDAGSPHIACRKDCCRALFTHPDPDRQVTALGVVDTQNAQQFLFEASPDISRQLKHLSTIAGFGKALPDGIFLTHAHIGHYTGLMYLGREATNADSVPVWAMPRMAHFLRTNGPWQQLVDIGNITLQPLRADHPVALTTALSVTPLRVPHRDEYSETVGYRIDGPDKSALFIPDIDKWERWETPIESLIATVDYAFLDGTFFDAEELNTRDISQIPHPFVSESLVRFAALPAAERNKVHFIHFNHTNRLLASGSAARQQVMAAGMHVADKGDIFILGE